MPQSARILPLQLTKRAKRALMFNHSIPGLVLIVAGVASLKDGWHEHSWIDLLGLIAGVLLIVALVRELRSKHSHGKIAWFDVIAGIVIMLEGYHELHPGKWFQPGSFLMVLGAFFFLFGLFHSKLPDFRKLTCTDEGFTVRTRPLRRFSDKWEGIKSFSLDKTKLLIRMQDDTLKKRSLRAIENRDEVLKVLTEELNVFLSKAPEAA